MLWSSGIEWTVLLVFLLVPVSVVSGFRLNVDVLLAVSCSASCLMTGPGGTFLQTGVQSLIAPASSAGRYFNIAGTVLVWRRSGASGRDGAWRVAFLAPPAHTAGTDICRTELPLLLQVPLLSPGHGAGLALPQTPPDPHVARGFVCQFGVLFLLVTLSSASLLAWHDSRKAVLSCALPI